MVSSRLEILADLQPFRHPIVSVVGKPIHVEKNPTPSDEMVQDFQQKYIDELMR
jgi:2-acylglycerol O-acyltransferase 2